MNEIITTLAVKLIQSYETYVVVLGMFILRVVGMSSKKEMKMVMKDISEIKKDISKWQAETDKTFKHEGVKVYQTINDIKAEQKTQNSKLEHQGKVLAKIQGYLEGKKERKK